MSLLISPVLADAVWIGGGSVWVADAHGGRVAVFNADGSHRKDIPVPLPMVTSLAFGGDDLRDLYIVTGSRGGPRENCGIRSGERATASIRQVPSGPQASFRPLASQPPPRHALSRRELMIDHISSRRTPVSVSVTG